MSLKAPASLLRASVSRSSDRMPVILTDEQEWLDWLIGTQHDVIRLCEPIERPDLNAERVP